MSESPEAEWDDITPEEVAEMEASLIAMRDCDHDWEPLKEGDYLFDLGPWPGERCPRCGATQFTLSKDEFEKIAVILEDGRVGDVSDT